MGQMSPPHINYLGNAFSGFTHSYISVIAMAAESLLYFVLTSRFINTHTTPQLLSTYCVPDPRFITKFYKGGAITIIYL